MNSIVVIFAAAILVPCIIVSAVRTMRRDIGWQSSKQARLKGRLAEGAGRFTKGTLLLDPRTPRWIAPDTQMSLAGFRLVTVAEPNRAMRLRIFAACFVLESPDGARWSLFTATGNQAMLEDVFGQATEGSG